MGKRRKMANESVNIANWLRVSMVLASFCKLSLSACGCASNSVDVLESVLGSRGREEEPEAASTAEEEVEEPEEEGEKEEENEEEEEDDE